MKTASSDLYYLIKSMSKSEKSFFKRISGRDEKNVLQSLFNIIDKQNDYSEEAILTSFKKKSSVKQFSVLKNHLYNRILHSLNYLHGESTLALRIRENINKTEILANRGLHQQAYKLLKKTKNTAYSFGEFTSILYLLKIEKNLIKNLYPSGALEKFDELLDEQLDVQNKLKNLAVYNWINSKVLFLIIKYGYIRSKTEDSKFREILENDLMKSEDMALTEEARKLYNGIYSLYYFGKLDYPKAYKYTKRTLNLWESNLEILTENPISYLRVSMDMLSLCFHMNKFSEIKRISGKIESLLNTKKFRIPEYLRVFTIGYLLCFRLTGCAVTGNFGEGDTVESEGLDYLKKYNQSVDKRIKYSLIGTISFYNLVQGKYPEALKWISKIINEPKDVDYINAYLEAVIIELILHYELGNLDTLEYRLDSYKRSSNKKNKLYEIEKIITKYFRKLVKNYKTEQQHYIFNDFLTELKRRNNVYFQRVAKETIDIFSWLESKIQNKSFADILKSKSVEKVKSVV